MLEKRLIILQPYTDCKTLAIRNFFLDNEWEVVFISPNQTHKHHRSVLLLPDSGGINANVSYFLKESTLPPNIPPQDQALEFFRLNTLSWYMRQQEQAQAKVGILGIGYSAFLTFAECLGGSVYYRKSELHFGVCNDKDTYIYDDHFINSTRRIAGLTAPSLENILSMANTLLKGGGSSTVPVTVPKAPLTDRI